MTDTVPILLDPGVSYLPQSAVDKFGLTKLKALNGGGNIVVTNSDLGTLTNVRLDELMIDHDWNHRGHVAPIDVMDLAHSIKQDKLQSPITVQPWTDPNNPKIKYKVVAGHRRATAVKVFLKWETIPAFVKVYENQLSARTASLIENLQRKGLNIKQEAHALKPFLEAYWSEQQIADHLSQSRGWVKIRLQLLELCDKVQDYAAADLITQEHIRFLQGKSETQQLEFIREVKEAKAKGDKILIEKPVKKTNPHIAKPKTRSEIFEKMTELYGIYGEMGFWARCMSYCAGQISEYELMKDVEKWAVENGHPYRIPHEMLMAKIAL